MQASDKLKPIEDNLYAASGLTSHCFLFQATPMSSPSQPRNLNEAKLLGASRPETSIKASTHRYTKPEPNYGPTVN